MNTRVRPLVTSLLFWALTPPLAAVTFSEYWYAGLGEVTSYRLEQARYGEIHSGHAVLVFVIEDFSRARQVKVEGREPGDAATSVLKLNFTRKFETGIYPYSMMTSVFAPVDRPGEGAALKVTTTSQEWCGHTFAQLNRVESGAYRSTRFSYFGSEGDEVELLPPVVLEDDVWTAIRLGPEDLPVGELEMLPGTQFLRLRHVPWRPARALGTLEPGGETTTYRLDYPDLGRSLAIRFRTAFPYEIESWEERGPSGWGAGATSLVTRGERIERLRLDYWNHHGVEDGVFRERLGLTSHDAPGPP